MILDIGTRELIIRDTNNLEDNSSCDCWCKRVALGCEKYDNQVERTNKTKPRAKANRRLPKEAIKLIIWDGGVMVDIGVEWDMQ